MTGHIEGKLKLDAKNRSTMVYGLAAMGTLVAYLFNKKLLRRGFFGSATSATAFGAAVMGLLQPTRAEVKGSLDS